MSRLKVTLSSIAAAALLAASVGLFTVNASAITFKESNSQELKRKMPEGEGVLLSYYDAVKDAKKSVVNIFTQKTVKQNMQANPFMNDPFFREFFGKNFGNGIPKDRVERSLGSGVIVSSDGYIVTNNHVIANSDTVMVFLADEKKEYKAKVVGADPKTDLAVIKIEAKNLPPIAFSDSSKVKEGDVVFAIGNPFGVGETITHGIVSALNKNGIGLNEYENFIQTDTPINPGNSGGALIDSRGGLVGINTAIISPTGQNNGIGFAIPANMAKNIAKTLIEKGKVERGFIGVSMRDLNAQSQKFYGKEKGAIVMDVVKNSPAQKAGLKRGDLIISINGKEVENSSELKNIVGSSEVGSEIKLGVIRDKKQINLSVKIEKAGSKEIQNGEVELLDGLTLENINDVVRKKYDIPAKLKGALVTDIKEGSLASKIGVAVGDIIVQVDNKEVTSADEVKALGSIEGKQLFINRRGVMLMIIASEN
jgi:serine protease Do